MSGLAWFPMARRSPNPSVTTSADQTPSRSSSAFVATVVASDPLDAVGGHGRIARDRLARHLLEDAPYPLFWSAFVVGGILRKQLERAEAGLFALRWGEYREPRRTRR